MQREKIKYFLKAWKWYFNQILIFILHDTLVQQNLLIYIRWCVSLFSVVTVVFDCFLYLLKWCVLKVSPHLSTLVNSFVNLIIAYRVNNSMPNSSSEKWIMSKIIALAIYHYFYFYWLQIWIANPTF